MEPETWIPRSTTQSTIPPILQNAKRLGTKNGEQTNKQTNKQTNPHSSRNHNSQEGAIRIVGTTGDLALEIEGSITLTHSILEEHNGSRQVQELHCISAPERKERSMRTQLSKTHEAGGAGGVTMYRGIAGGVGEEPYRHSHTIKRSIRCREGRRRIFQIPNRTMGINGITHLFGSFTDTRAHRGAPIRSPTNRDKQTQEQGAEGGSETPNTGEYPRRGGGGGGGGERRTWQGTCRPYQHEEWETRNSCGLPITDVGRQIRGPVSHEVDVHKDDRLRPL